MTGRLYFGLQGLPRDLSLKDLEGRAERCQATSGRDGSFRCDLGKVAGDLLLEVDTGSETRIQTMLQGVELGENREAQATPVTHLIAKRAEYLIGAGSDADVAFNRSRVLLEQHFGGVPHSAVLPDNVYRGTEKEPVLLEGPIAGVLMAALDELAERITEQAFRQVDTFRVVELLGEDLESDGVFNGKGDKREIAVGAYTFSGDTLRAEYAAAVGSWLASDQNKSGLVAHDFRGITEAIASNRSELFEDAADALGPEITSVEVFDSKGEQVFDEAIAGRLSVRVKAEDDAGVQAILARVGGADLENREGESGKGYFEFETSGLLDGIHRLTVIATDTEGNQSEVFQEIKTDNTPPTVSATASASVVRSSPVGVIVTVTDSIGPVERVVVSRGTQVVEVVRPDETVEVVIDVDCNQRHELEVVAEDAAGNTAQDTVTVSCDDVQPQFDWVTTYQDQEGSMVAEYSADGSSVDYRFPATPDVLTLNRYTPFPVRFEKYFNRLDSWSEGLPTFHFNATDANGVRVEYRYSVDGVIFRSWTQINPARGEPEDYLLYVSYQSLTEQLWQAPRDAIHKVEFRAVDPAGNEKRFWAEFQMELLSPPMWIGGCHLASELSNYTLAGGTLHEIYQQGRTPVMAATMRFNPGLAAGSAAPRGGALATFVGGEVTSRILHISEETHFGPNYNAQGAGQRCPTIPSHLFCSEADRVNGYVMATNGACEAGPVPAEQTVWAPEEGLGHFRGVVELQGPHNHEISLLAGGGPAVSVGAAKIVAVDAFHDLVLELVDPEARFASGQPYDFSTDLNLPGGYSMRPNTPTRYRMPSDWYAAGVDFQPCQRTFCSQLGDAKWFVTRPYISGFVVEVQELAPEVMHETMPHVEVGVQRAPECAGGFVYTTQM